MTSTDPPPFQESARCDVCHCSFSTFKRRHHCRCCGRTLCHEHSSNQMALPQFGIYSNVRVCADCFNNSRSAKDASQSSADGVNNITDTISKLDIDANECPKTPTSGNKPVSDIKECKCGMPLCICEAPAPSTGTLPQQKKPTPDNSGPSNPKPKKSDTVPKNRSSTSNSKFSSTFNPGHVTNGASNRTQIDYEANGEGLREAIKNGDCGAVKKLLNEGVDANYRDKQGMSLLHLAAVFNQTDIVFILMDSGASLEFKNAQGETPLDCAPATLQYKMRNKMEESRATTNQSI